MTSTKLRLGEDATVLREDHDGVEVESGVRLAPGRWIELHGQLRSSRRAFVWSWQVVRVGSPGLRYRGWCRWIGADGEGATPADGSALL